MGGQELERDLGVLVAEVLGVAPDAVGRARARQVLRRASGRTLTTWSVEAAGRRRQVVTVVGEGGPRRGLASTVLADGSPAVAFLPRDDPRLPGLRVALDPDLLAELLGRPVLATRRRRYRPLGRAVVEATTATGTVWCKVLRPPKVTDLAQLHARAAGVVPGPPVELLDAELGLLVLGHLPGVSLRTLLRSGEGGLPPVERVLDVAAALADLPTDAPTPRTPPLDASRRSVERLRGIVPEQGERLDRIGRALERAAEQAPPGPSVTIHGDLHAAQLLVVDGRVTGLLDLDDVGLGQTTDELARLVGHTACTVAGATSRPADRWLVDLERAVAARVALSSLAPRVAAVVTGLASGPHRVQADDWRLRTLRRLGLVEKWLMVGDAA